MASYVIKSDGTRVPFEGGKILASIEAAGLEGELPLEQVNQLVQEISGPIFQYMSGKDEISTEEIRIQILTQLQRIGPEAAAAWERYDTSRGR